MSSIDLEKMTKEEALEYMGLPSDANDFIIDEKFWKMSKNLRGKSGEENEEALNELSAVYNIACGRRDEALAKQEAYAREKKIAGKTKGEWKNFFSYEWFKILVIAVIAVCLVSILYSVFTNRYDVSIVVFGHMDVETELLGDSVKSDEIKKPYVTYVDIVVPNDQGATDNVYADQSFASAMNAYPNILITDTMTYKYYYGYYHELDSLYDAVWNSLASQEKAVAEPVYLSEREAFEFTEEYYKETGMADGSTAEECDPTPVLIGFKLKDKESAINLGIEEKWPDTDEGLIICINRDTTDIEASQKMLISIIQRAAIR